MNAHIREEETERCASRFFLYCSLQSSVNNKQGKKTQDFKKLPTIFLKGCCVTMLNLNFKRTLYCAAGGRGLVASCHDKLHSAENNLGE